MSEFALQTIGLTKSYGWVRAFLGADLSARKGEVLSVLDPSGAGKIAIIRVSGEGSRQLRSIMRRRPAALEDTS